MIVELAPFLNFIYDWIKIRLPVYLHLSFYGFADSDFRSYSMICF